MTYLVGYTPDRSGSEALALARTAARRPPVDLAICVVVPEPWDGPSPANVEFEYRDYIARSADKALEKARTALGEGIDTRFMVVAARTAAEGLAAAADDIGAEAIILGSPQDGPSRRCSFGSVGGRLMAIAGRPVMLAPRGFKRPPGEAVERVTCAYVEGPESDGPLAVARDLARRHKVPLRLVTFVVRDRQMYPSNVGYDAEALIANAWREQALEAQARALAMMPPEVETLATLGDGPTWRKAIEAVEWKPGELLVAGAQSVGSWGGRVFGSPFTRILRHAQVPVVAVP
ncbi:universal stress protein [Segnochrobactrum spirostomi]|uniref:Universal stress protein n=1 Tax=Segnochrobactrum spirostomi TaxID=2608987 RepID=A0A6A7YBK4_9HYPH|nr:universal stress protein [Segnochrobactrum spirostomi]MQT15042.1 universal stress protein [Segnochrobactrum spirostomi]